MNLNQIFKLFGDSALIGKQVAKRFDGDRPERQENPNSLINRFHKQPNNYSLTISSVKIVNSSHHNILLQSVKTANVYPIKTANFM